MRLGYVTASFPYGQGEAFLAPEIHALASAGVEVLVLPLYPRGPRRAEWVPGVRVDVLQEGLWSVEILRATLAGFTGRSKLALQGARSLLDVSPRKAMKNLMVIPKALWIAREATRASLDHIHVHWAGTTASAGMLASQLSGIPWSMTCHRWDIYEDNCLPAKVGAARFTRFISSRGRADAIALGADPSRTHVAPLGAPLPPRWQPPPWRGSGILRIVCPANLVPVKGHRYLLAACKSLESRGMDFRLLLAGDGPLRRELEQSVRTLGLSGRVDFLGHVDHGMLLRMYSEGDAHVVVLPSVDLGDGLHEGVPVALMEAMAHGVPVISTRTGSIPELLPAAMGLTVEPEDPEALAEAVARLVRDPGGYREAATACRERVAEGWSMERAARRLIDLIETKA